MSTAGENHARCQEAGRASGFARCQAGCCVMHDLVTVVVGLVRPRLRYAQVFGLVGAQLGNMAV